MNRQHFHRQTAFWALLALLGAHGPAAAERESDTMMELPPLAAGTVLYDSEVKFGYRGKSGVYAMPPSRVGVYFDDRVNFSGGGDSTAHRSTQSTQDMPSVIIEGLEERKGTHPETPVSGTLVTHGKESIHPGESACVMYDLAPGRTFCGAYFILLADLTPYACMSFRIKGAKGGETFELGMNDAISNKREDAVVIGSIYRYLPGGVTTDWQEVIIPIEDFYGPDMTRVFSIVFLFNELGSGKFWVDDFRFHKTMLVDREAEIRRQGFLLLDNFDHSDVNLLGRKCGVYTKFPSLCRKDRVEEPRPGDHGRSLELRYDKKGTGWCGYYTLLNQVDGEYYNLRSFDSISFKVRGETGGELFELGLADRNWINIGDSLKAGPITDYLPDGITTNWQEATIPLEDFGLLDFSEMGSFVINFHEKGAGTVYIDDLRVNRSNEETAP